MGKNCFKKLQELRIKNGYSYQRMADELKISKCFYWQLENKKRNITYKMAFKIANILHTKPDTIFLDELKNDMETTSKQFFTYKLHDKLKIIDKIKYL